MIESPPGNAAGLGAGRISDATGLLLSTRVRFTRKLASLAGQGFLLLITSASAIAVLFIFIYIIRDSLPFFQERGFREFLTSTRWYPAADSAEFGALAIIFGSTIVTIGAVAFAVPLAVFAAVCLSDVLPFSYRQLAKPVIEMLAGIPSVAYGFFALVVLAPLLQERGGFVLACAAWAVGVPLSLLLAIVAGETTVRALPTSRRRVGRYMLMGLFGMACLWGVHKVAGALLGLEIGSGTNAFNVSVILGIMVLPTIVSVSEDALQAVGRELREASYALGATRAETLLRVVIPAASSGICAAIILGIMRAVGETMVVWMASGNAAQIPEPWYNFMEPVRTLTATIAGDMGEADHVTGSARYHVLFAMAACLLTISFLCNLASEYAVRRERKRLRGG